MGEPSKGGSQEDLVVDLVDELNRRRLWSSQHQLSAATASVEVDEEALEDPVVAEEEEVVVVVDSEVAAAALVVHQEVTEVVVLAHEEEELAFKADSDQRTTETVEVVALIKEISSVNKEVVGANDQKVHPAEITATSLLGEHQLMEERAQTISKCHDSQCKECRRLRHLRTVLAAAAVVMVTTHQKSGPGIDRSGASRDLSYQFLQSHSKQYTSFSLNRNDR